MLDLPYLYKLMNDPIMHHPTWSPVLLKIPIDIPKFDEKTREDPTTHITTYHLWCISNSMLDDSIKLHLLPCTFTENASKWFIELLTTSFSDFSALAMAFLTHFQLPIRYKQGQIFSRHYPKTPLHTSPIISMSGDGAKDLSSPNS